MKRSLFGLMGLLLVLSFASSCGKSSKSGGSSGSSSNSVLSGNSSGETAYNTLKSWYDGSAEASTVGIHGYYLRDTSPNSTSAMCLQSGYIAWCAEPTGCFKHTNIGIQVGTVQIKNTTVLGANFKNYKDCDITSSFSLYTKSGNSALSAAVNGTSGKYLIKSLTVQSGSYITVYYGSFDGATTANSYAVINTSVPSIMNPVEVGTVSYGYRTATEKVTDYRQAY